MTKQKSLYKDLKRATKRLKEASALPQTDINRDATIQRFEFTFELSWKLMQTITSEHVTAVYGPKNTIREAAKIGLIENPEEWIKFLKQRNLATHTYNEKLAKEVYRFAKEFVKYAKDLLKSTEKHITN